MELSSKHTYDYTLRFHCKENFLLFSLLLRIRFDSEQFYLLGHGESHKIESFTTIALRTSNPHFDSAAGNFTRTGIPSAGTLTV